MSDDEEARKERRRAYRREWARKRRRALGMAERPRSTVEHGDVAGYHRHRRAGEEPCKACRLAWRDYHRERRKGRAAAPEA